MWLSLNIIKKMVDLNGISVEELAQRLTMSTAEIDGIEQENSHFKTVYAAKILDVKPHPNADKLTLVDLDRGGKQVRVVCGAPNHKIGDIVPLADVGTDFGGGFVIKQSKIRGEESFGMLCSEKELGLSEDHSGIMVLSPDTPLGKTLSELYPDRVDVRLEIDNKSITHRPDLWSHVGFAREIGALFGRPVKDVIDYSLEKDFKKEADLKVTIKNPEAAPRYTGLVVKNIRIGESPEWLKAAVTSIGMRPINNIVDITNYVMAEIGEPMHAFDRKKLTDNEIIVRLAGEGEEIMTLDGQAFKLSPEDIVIADRSKPIAVAGVMGGGNSEIEDGTTEIVLEAANFNPVYIRKTAQRYNMRTEAAIRFEKSLSPEVTRAAIIRCYDLIKQCIPGAIAASELIDAYPVKQGEIVVETDTAFICKRLGHVIDDGRITGILTALDFKIKQDGKRLTINVPYYRATKDVSIPEDIVEEVGRIYGYDNIPEKVPLVTCTTPNRNRFRLFERRVKDILTKHFNMIETSGYSFTGEAVLEKLGINEDRELRLANPLSQEQDRLRRSLVPNMVQNILVNQRYHDTFATFELGRVYLKQERKSADLIAENTRVTGVVYSRSGEPLPFYEVRAAAEGLFARLRLRSVSLKPVSEGLPPYAHPGRALEVVVDGKTAGLIAGLHPRVLQTFEINGRAAFFDLDLNLLSQASKAEMVFTELQKYPEVPFELSILADERTYADDILAVVRKGKLDHVRTVEVKSIYAGDPIPAGKKSVSIRVIFAAPDKTLSPEEINSLQKKVIDLLAKKGFSLR